MSSNNPPPPPNPVLSAYESFVRDTPLVTRYTLSSQCISWFVSFFFNPSYALGTIPSFVVTKLEIYRIILSPLVCDSALSLVFAYLSFLDNGKRLEFSMGSTAFAWLMVTITVVTNVTFCILMFGLSGLTNEKGFLLSPSSGIWTVLFGIIAIECVKAPPNSQRRFFFLTVPTIYYPLILWLIFSLLFGGLNLAFLISIGVGYAHGYVAPFSL